MLLEERRKKEARDGEARRAGDEWRRKMKRAIKATEEEGADILANGGRNKLGGEYQ